MLRESGTIPKFFITSNELLEKRKLLLRCTTGSTQLDDLFNDGQGNVGVESQAVTEFYGEFGSGKSQICHTLAVLAQQPVESKGLGGSVLVIDTEGTYRPERVSQIASTRNFDPNVIGKSILICRVANAAELEKVVNELNVHIREYNIKLVIVDSISSLHRSEFAGRGTLADRQQKLNKIMHKLIRVAEVLNTVVVITNQITTSPGIMFGDPTSAVGGNVIGHNSTYRVYLLKRAQQKRTARMVDSPSHVYGERMFTVNEKGVVDLEEDKK
jgi:DNA repair protein RadA